MRTDGLTASFTYLQQLIDCRHLFNTTSPKASCNGRIVLIPVLNNERVEWKIWILSTWIDQLDVHIEDERLLKSPNTKLGCLDDFETDVFIIGGGNAQVKSIFTQDAVLLT